MEAPSTSHFYGEKASKRGVLANGYSMVVARCSDDMTHNDDVRVYENMKCSEENYLRDYECESYLVGVKNVSLREGKFQLVFIYYIIMIFTESSHNEGSTYNISSRFTTWSPSS